MSGHDCAERANRIVDSGPNDYSCRRRRGPEQEQQQQQQRQSQRQRAAATSTTTTLSLWWAQRQKDDIILVMAGIREVQPEPGGTQDSCGRGWCVAGTSAIIIIIISSSLSGLQLVSLAALSSSFVCLALSSLFPCPFWPIHWLDWVRGLRHGKDNISGNISYSSLYSFFFCFLLTALLRPSHVTFTTRYVYAAWFARCHAARSWRDPLQASAEIGLKVQRIRRAQDTHSILLRQSSCTRSEARHALQIGLRE